MSRERENTGERGAETGQAPAELMTETLADTAPSARRPGGEGLEGCLGWVLLGAPGAGSERGTVGETEAEGWDAILIRASGRPGA